MAEQLKHASAAEVAAAVEHQPGSGFESGDAEGQPLKSLAQAAAAGAASPPPPSVASASAANGGETSDEPGPASSACEECGEVASWRCDSCSASLCDTHDGDAHRLKMTRGHVRVPIVVIVSAAAAQVEAPLSTTCALHPSELKSVYCSDCEQVVCSTCVGEHGKHRTHATQADFAQAVAKVKLRREGLAAQLGKRCSSSSAPAPGQGGAAQVAKDLELLLDHQKTLEASSAQSLRVLDAVCDEIIAAVQARRKDLSESVRAKQAAASSVLEGLLKSAREASASCDDLAQFIAAASSGSSLLRILSMEELVSSRFASASGRVARFESEFARALYAHRVELSMDPLATQGVLKAVRDLGTVNDRIVDGKWGALQSRILDTEQHCETLARFFEGTPVKLGGSDSTPLLYRASRDGFLAKDWSSRCVGDKVVVKGRGSLTLVKAAHSGNVFGFYAHFSLPTPAKDGKDARDKDGKPVLGPLTVSDPTGKSFLFSLKNGLDPVVAPSTPSSGGAASSSSGSGSSNSNGRPLKFKLDKKHRALSLVAAGSGPSFGAGAAGHIASVASTPACVTLMVEGRPADAYNGCADFGAGFPNAAFVVDTECERKAGLPAASDPPVAKVATKGFFSGSVDGTFQCAEIEVYSISAE